MNERCVSFTASELASMDFSGIPSELKSGEHLIYSSPATLSFNSPGAQGFGVKRAGLAIPGSVMLLVAPGCCGRNTSVLSDEKRYGSRFFYLLQDDTDIVTGRHLMRIPRAVKEVVDSLDEKPSCVMICTTCVDALLGTDVERVCRKSTDKAGVPVIPCYMYALTRDGSKPPMVEVRKSIYSLLEERPRKSNVVNLLGEFSPYDDETELYDILHKLGIKKINEISRCKTFEEYKKMAEANFNIVINPECRYAADDIYKRLGIPAVSLTRQYRIDKIHSQYQLFGGAIGCKIDDSEYYGRAERSVKQFSEKFGGEKPLKIAIGEWMNGDPFEMAAAFAGYGMKITEIFGTVTDTNLAYIRKLASMDPDVRIYTNLHPTMINYDMSRIECDITIGKDAGYYHPDCPNIPWNSEDRPFGYAGLEKLLKEIEKNAGGAE
ncbi:MAG: nitrogenase component 1 [Lachnospiraceae bacterium]